MTANKIALATFAASLLLPAAANAQQVDLKQEAPNYSIVNPVGQTNAVRADLSTLIISDDGLTGVVTRLDLRAHGYLNNSNYGGYIHVPISRGFFDTDGDPFLDAANTTALGAVELGFASRHRISPELGLTTRVGVARPLDSSNFEGFFVNAISVFARPDDAFAFFDTTQLRLGGSAHWNRGNLFARADAGIDVLVEVPDNVEVDSRILVRGNAAAGLRTGKLTFAGELVNVFSPGGDGEKFIHFGAVSAEYNAGRLKPSLSVSSPLDSEPFGEAITISAGVTANL